MPYILLPKATTSPKLLTASLAVIYFLAVIVVLAYPDSKEQRFNNSYSTAHISNMALVNITTLFKEGQ